MAKLDLESLTTKQIAELYGKTKEEFIKQRDSASVKRTHNADFDEQHYIDGFGNAIPGIKPVAESVGFGEDRLVDEWRNRNKTPTENLTDWVNQNQTDPEIAALLPHEEHVVLTRYRDYEISGRFDNKEWHIVAVDTVSNGPDIRFRMDGRFDQDEAAVHARNGVKNELAIRPRELTETEINFVRRIAPTNRELAVALFLKSRLPATFERELNQLAAEIEATGSSLELLKFMSHPDVNDVAAEAVSEVWRWAQPHLRFTPELEEFLQERTTGNVLSFVLLDRLLKEFYLGRQSALTTEPPPVSQEGLNNLADDEVESLYNRSRTEYLAGKGRR